MYAGLVFFICGLTLAFIAAFIIHSFVTLRHEIGSREAVKVCVFVIALCLILVSVLVSCLILLVHFFG